jgi:hypothetical protein
MIIIPDDVIKDDKLDVKENGTLITHKGDIVQEQVPIDRVPEKLFGQVRSQDLPELLESTIDAEVSISEVQKESELEDLGEIEEPSINVVNPEMEAEATEDLLPEDVIVGSEPEETAWDPAQAKSDMMNWAKDDEGTISKKSLMKWYLDVDAGNGQDQNSYRYQVGAIVNGSPHYCHKALDFSWDLASGNQTGVANRNIQKKIIFIKNREGIPLTSDQMDFTERHMSAEKVTYHTLKDDNSPGGIEFVDQTELKLNSSPAGSKVIFEDDNVIDVPVVPMREGVFTGTDGIPTLKKYEYFGKDAHWLEGQPILKGHTAPTELVTYKHNRIGKLMNVTARPDKRDVVAVARYYKDKLTPEDLTRIKSGTPYDGSIAYTTHTSMTSGDLNGTKYNAVEDGGYHFYHFAELANGIGACSTKDGCGFMLNETEQKLNAVSEPKVFYNDKRRAEVTQEESVWTVKLNSSVGGSGILEADTEQDAIEWSRTYVKSGLIPISMKLNYNCPDSEKSGSGKGACGGSDGKGSSNEKSSKTSSLENKPMNKDSYSKWQGTYKKLVDKFSTDKSDDPIVIQGQNITSKIDVNSEASIRDGLGNVLGLLVDNYKVPGHNEYGKGSSPENQKKGEGQQKLLDVADYLNDMLEDKMTQEGKSVLSRNIRRDKFLVKPISKKSKQNSQFSKSQTLIGNNMTEEFIKADDTEETDVDIVKMNEAFEQKLNERDAKIAELTEQVDDLVQKQNAAEQALVDKKAAEDFEAFTQKLNKAHQKDAQVHYDAFKSDGWAYFGAHPEVFQVDIPKQNAFGSPAAEGDNATALQQARDMLKKAQKERFSKRA